MRTNAWVLVIGMLALDCDASPPAADQDYIPVLEGAPLAIKVDGCAALYQPSLCIRKPGDTRALTLWSDEPSPLGATWSLTSQGRAVPDFEFTDYDGVGTWWVVENVPAHGVIELRRSDGRAFALEVGTLPGAALEFGCAATKFQKAAREVDDVTCRATAQMQSATAALDKGDFELAAADIEMVRAAGSLELQSQVYADYFAGVLELRLGRLDLALMNLERAREVAVRTQPADLRASIDDKLALTYFVLGYDEDSREAASRVDGSSWLAAQSNLLWLAVLRREADPREPDPVPELQELLVEPKLRPETARNVRLNLAIGLTQNQHFDAASELLDEVDFDALELRSRLFADIAEARVAAGWGQLDHAREVLNEALELAGQSPDADLELRVHHELAQLEHDAGDIEMARQHYANAEDTIHARLAKFGPSADLSALSGAHTKHRAKYLLMLRELGELSELRCVMVGARARHYQQLAARSWALDDDPERSKRLREIAKLRDELEQGIAKNWDATSAERVRLKKQWEKQRTEIARLYAELDRNLEPGDLAQICAPWTATEHGRLLMHPGLTPGQWIFAFERAGNIDAFTLVRGERELPAFVDEIHAQLDARGHLEQLTQLTVVSLDELVTADFHTRLHARARPIEVRYSLGLGARPSTPHTTNALVYASTQGALPGAERATSGIARNLQQAWSVSREWPTTLDPSLRPELLLYTGHGASAGTFGFGSYLDLGGAGPLTSAQIIAQRWGPRVVVLGTCEGGTSSEEAVDGGMNMATAFLLAGSEVVIASDERVLDPVGAELLCLLFEKPLTPENAGTQLQEALTRVQASTGDFRGCDDKQPGEREATPPGEDNPSHASWRVWVR